MHVSAVVVVKTVLRSGACVRENVFYRLALTSMFRFQAQEYLNPAKQAPAKDTIPSGAIMPTRAKNALHCSGRRPSTKGLLSPLIIISKKSSIPGHGRAGTAHVRLYTRKSAGLLRGSQNVCICQGPAWPGASTGRLLPASAQQVFFEPSQSKSCKTQFAGSPDRAS